MSRDAELALRIAGATPKGLTAPVAFCNFAFALRAWELSNILFDVLTFWECRASGELTVTPDDLT